MVSLDQAEAAFTKIIKHGPGAGFRKAADTYWTAVRSEAGASEDDGKQFELAISKIPIDYRTPALKCLDDFNTCKEANGEINDCYFELAIQLADRIVHVL